MSEQQLQILPILTEDLTSPERLTEIRQAKQELYWSLDWTPEFYIQLAKQGFISTAVYLDQAQGQIPILLPEMQKAYSVLRWENLRMSRSMQRWMRSETFHSQDYRLSLHHNLEEIIIGLRQCHGDNCWLIPPYLDLLQKLNSSMEPYFELIPVGLLNNQNQLIAGEIGYRTGNIYTSLTGFYDRSDPEHNHAGKLQMHLLAKHLQKENYTFWNLGHPGMQYKLDLGATVLPRAEFLDQWQLSVEK